MSTSTARKNEDASIRPLQGIQISCELLLGERMVQSICIFLESPILGIVIDVCPMETGPAMRRIAKVIHFMSYLAKLFDNTWVKRISPTGGDVNLGHGV